MKSGEKPCTGAGSCIFISYSHKDSGRVFPVLDAMLKCGYRVCYDGMIPAGEPWTKFLAEHISDCAVFLPFLSADFLASGQCLKEVRFMDSKGKLVVPVWLEKPDRNGVPPEVEFLLNKSQELRLDDFPDAAAFAAHLQWEPNFRSCRDADADTVPAAAELVTNERPVAASPSFVGRVQIMDDIERAFRDGATVVNLYGMGGLGKSEICRKLFWKYAQETGTRIAHYIGWATWRGTLKETFYQQFLEIETPNIHDHWAEAETYMRKLGADLLVFLDNADDMKPKQAAELTRLGCRFLVTSRQRKEPFRDVISAGTLAPEECRILYRRALSDDAALTDDSPDAALDEIIRLAGCHTLAVRLLANTQWASGLDAWEMLEQMQESGFDLRLPETVSYLHNPENADANDDGQRTFFEHMTLLFDLSTLREPKNTDVLRALQGMSLLAPNEPIAVRDVKKWLDLPNLQGLNDAIRLGWLNDETKSGVRTVSIHPVIAAVVQHDAMPDKTFLDALAGRLFKDMAEKGRKILL